MSTEFALLVLAAIDVGAAYVAHRLAKWEDHSGSGDAVPMSRLLPVMLGAFLAHVTGTGLVASTVDLGSPGGRLVVTAGSVVCGILPAILFARILIRSVSDTAVNQLYSMKTAHRQETDCTGARAAYHRGEVDEALRIYRRLFRENPQHATPLLEADRMLKEAGRNSERIELLRDILVKCKDDLPAWAEAAYSMADLQEQYLEDPRCADTIRREIIKRAPRSDYANMAREMLLKRHTIDSG